MIMIVMMIIIMIVIIIIIIIASKKFVANLQVEIDWDHIQQIIREDEAKNL